MWWERLAKAMEREGLDVEELAKLSKVPAKSIYGYLKGETQNPRGTVLERLSGAVGVTEKYLRFGDIPVPTVEVHSIPLLSIHGVSAFTDGKKILTDVVVEKTIVVPVKHPERCFGVTSEDTANVPEIGEGHVVVFDVGADLQPGKLILVSSPDEETAYIGRYRPLKPNSRESFILRFDNTDYPEMTANEEHPNHILARAVGVFKEL